MKYTARKPFLYGNKIYMAGDGVPVYGDDVRMLQGQGKIGAPIIKKPEVKKVETAMVRPAETAMKPPAEHKPLPRNIENMNKNQLVRELNLRGIEHNKRQVRAELIALLRGD